ncbi:hypothetical protein GII32_18045 [Gordonia amarae]|uniref:FcoT family thioesterase n=1 Tax=Gordonia amarae TaxID=36821 RepID=UPI001AF14DB1|nr:FcoT family thioesterase [Gordonia amarae]QHN32023.1 hypothetical protein GII32_18045 [Gordonia amarae]
MTMTLPEHHHQPSDTELFTRVMAPYAAKRAIYLTGPPVVTIESGHLCSTGRFSIAEPCYIDDTGHFNAAEFIICYNQLMYHTLAVAVRDELTPQFAAWTLEDYWAKQLPDVLIVEMSSRFTRPIASLAFTGTFTVTSVMATSRLLVLDTEIGFTDDTGGRCSGTIRLAVVQHPVKQ